VAIDAPWITVGVTRTELTAGLDDDAIPGSALAVRAPAALTLWVGGPNVDGTTRGFPIDPGATATFDLRPGDRLYGIAPGGTGTAYVLRTGI
jgi:hypothetical protein